MKSIVLLLLSAFFVSAAGAQPPPQAPTPNLGIEFVRLAAVAAKAIATDDLSVDVMKPNSTSDRIDEAGARAISGSENSFVDLLRGFLLNKEMHNLLVRMKRATGNLDAPSAGPCGDEKDCDRQFEDRLAHDRQISKNKLDDDRCFAALSDALKLRTYSAAPGACPGPRKKGKDGAPFAPID